MPKFRSEPAFDSGSRQNTVGLDRQDLGDLLDTFDRESRGGGSAKRVHTRWPFRAISLPVTFVHPGRSESRVRLACRNLSSGGIALLHSAYVHERTPCYIELPGLGGVKTMVTGTVARCTHREGVVHEVGVRFDEPIDVRNYFEVDPLSGWFSHENVDLENLELRLLHVDATLSARQAVRTMLGESNVRLKSEETAEEASAHDASSFDVLVLDAEMPDMDVCEFLVKFTSSSHAGVVLTSLVRNARLRHLARHPRVAGVIIKPIDAQRFLGGLLDALEISRRDITADEDWSDSVIADFTSEMRSFSGMIVSALEEHDAMSVYSSCTQMHSNAREVGFQEIAHLSGEVANNLSQRMDLRDVREELPRLLEACRRTAAAAA